MFFELFSWQLSSGKLAGQYTGLFFSADLSIPTRMGSDMFSLPRNIWQLCRNIGVTPNPSPASVPSCPCVVVSQEPLCGFVIPQASGYEKGQFGNFPGGTVDMTPHA